MTDYVLVHVSGSDKKALVSPGDRGLIIGYAWHLDLRPNSFGQLVPRRIRANGHKGDPRRMVSLHQLILGFPGGVIDHINGNIFDNRRENLRLADKRGNRANAKPNGDRPFKGITGGGGKWEAQIVSGGKKYYLGRFTTPEDAARAYDKAALDMFGDFARLNFPSA